MKLLFLTALTACTGATDTADSGDTGAATETERCGPDAEVGLELGLCAPEFTLPNGAGELVSLSSFRGKVALVDISAVW